MFPRILAPITLGLLFLTAIVYPALAQEPLEATAITTLDTSPVFTATTYGEPSHGAFYFTVGGWTIISNNAGEVIYSRQIGPRFSGLDFKRQGELLTYFYDGHYEAIDQFFRPAGQWAAVGHTVDHHDLQILENGHSLVLIYHPFTADMTAYGGSPTATVISCIVQELDQDNNLVWEWDSWNHIPITHSIVNLTRDRVDYDHCNAVEPDNDGNVLVSSRNLNSITKINHQTGDVIWRLGGKANDFIFTNDSGFALQHDIRRLDNGRITIFDNGDFPRGYSRGVEYEINETTKMVTRTWEYQGPFAFCCGNVQTLDDGHRVIGWGLAVPLITEVDENNNMIAEIELERGSYRAFKLPASYVSYFPSLFR